MLHCWLLQLVSVWAEGGSANGSSAPFQALLCSWLGGLEAHQPAVCWPHHAVRVQGWQLVLTGHSLGAGIAALLALKMLRTFPNAKVWAFCPPGGLMTGALAHFMEPFCTSVVLGKVGPTCAGQARLHAAQRAASGGGQQQGAPVRAAEALHQPDAW